MFYIKKIILILALLITFSCVSCTNTKGEEGLADFKNYTNLIKLVDADFSVDGYVNILKEQGNIVVVPDSIAGRQDLPNEGLYHRTKHYIYKNTENDIIVMLSITATHEKNKTKYWEHSIGYNPKIYNSNINKYKDTYDEEFTSAEIYLYSFSGEGYDVAIIATSNNPRGEEVYTLSKLAQFTDEFGVFLKDNGL